jgi:hypothetical protein
MGNLTTNAVKERARQLGADFVGVAPADLMADEAEGYKPGDLLPDAKFIISVGVRNLQSYMEKAPDPLFFMFGYRQKNDLINKIVWNTARMIDHEGYYALPIQAYGEGELFVDTTPLPGRGGGWFGGGWAQRHALESRMRASHSSRLNHNDCPAGCRSPLQGKTLRPDRVW